MENAANFGGLLGGLVGFDDEEEVAGEDRAHGGATEPLDGATDGGREMAGVVGVGSLGAGDAGTRRFVSHIERSKLMSR